MNPLQAWLSSSEEVLLGDLQTAWYGSLVVLVLAVVAIAVLWWRQRESSDEAPEGWSPAGLVEEWARGQRGLSSDQRAALDELPAVLVFSQPGIGVEQVITSYVGGEELFDAADEAGEAAPKVYLSDDVVVHLLDPRLLADTSREADLAARLLWKRLFAQRAPRVVLCLDGGEPTVDEEWCVQVRTKLRVLEEVVEEPVQLRVALTHLEQAAGFPPFAQVLGERVGDQPGEEPGARHPGVQSAVEERRLEEVFAGVLEEARRQRVRALTELEGADYLGFLGFVEGGEDLHVALRGLHDELASLDPTYDALYLCPGQGPGPADPFQPFDREPATVFPHRLVAIGVCVVSVLFLIAAFAIEGGRLSAAEHALEALEQQQSENYYTVVGKDEEVRRYLLDRSIFEPALTPAKQRLGRRYTEAVRDGVFRPAFARVLARAHAWSQHASAAAQQGRSLQDLREGRSPHAPDYFTVVLAGCLLYASAPGTANGELGEVILERDAEGRRPHVRRLARKLNYLADEIAPLASATTEKSPELKTRARDLIADYVTLTEQPWDDPAHVAGALREQPPASDWPPPVAASRDDFSFFYARLENALQQPFLTRAQLPCICQKRQQELAGDPPPSDQLKSLPLNEAAIVLGGVNGRLEDMALAFDSYQLLVATEVGREAFGPMQGFFPRLGADNWPPVSEPQLAARARLLERIARSRAAPASSPCDCHEERHRRPQPFTLEQLLIDLSVIKPPGGNLEDYLVARAEESEPQTFVLSRPRWEELLVRSRQHELVEQYAAGLDAEDFDPLVGSLSAAVAPVTSANGTSAHVIYELPVEPFTIGTYERRVLRSVRQLPALATWLPTQTYTRLELAVEDAMGDYAVRYRKAVDVSCASYQVRPPSAQALSISLERLQVVDSPLAFFVRELDAATAPDVSGPKSDPQGTVARILGLLSARLTAYDPLNALLAEDGQPALADYAASVAALDKRLAVQAGNPADLNLGVDQILPPLAQVAYDMLREDPDSYLLLLDTWLEEKKLPQPDPRKEPDLRRAFREPFLRARELGKPLLEKTIQDRWQAIHDQHLLPIQSRFPFDSTRDPSDPGAVVGPDELLAVLGPGGSFWTDWALLAPYCAEPVPQENPTAPPSWRLWTPPPNQPRLELGASGARMLNRVNALAELRARLWDADGKPLGFQVQVTAQLLGREAGPQGERPVQGSLMLGEQRVFAFNQRAAPMPLLVEWAAPLSARVDLDLRADGSNERFRGARVEPPEPLLPAPWSLFRLLRHARDEEVPGKPAARRYTWVPWESGGYAAEVGFELDPDPRSLLRLEPSAQGSK